MLIVEENKAIEREKQQAVEITKNEIAKYWEGYAEGVRETKDLYVCTEKKL